jgi:uncharacterized membrane-anchored protein
MPSLTLEERIEIDKIITTEVIKAGADKADIEKILPEVIRKIDEYAAQKKEIFLFSPNTIRQAIERKIDRHKAVIRSLEPISD